MRTEARDIQLSEAAQDKDFVQRLRDADPAAHGELRERFGAALHGFAAQRLRGNEELAEEVMVRTLVEVVRNIRRLDPTRGTLTTWVFGIARRKIQDASRKALRKKSVPVSAETSIAQTEEFTSDEDLSASVAARLDAQRQVARLARVLSETEMEVLLLHHVDGFSMGEIGRIVGRSAKAVDSLLHRARTKAREELVKSDG